MSKELTELDALAIINDYCPDAVEIRNLERGYSGAGGFPAWAANVTDADGHSYGISFQEWGPRETIATSDEGM